MGVFKAYDIRGIYGKELTDSLIEKIALAFGIFFEDFDTIGIVRDVRIHSKKIRDLLVENLTYTHNILDFGIGTTPEAHYLSQVYNIPVLMITASHNPPEYNGIKPIVLGEPLSTDDIKKIECLTKKVKRPDKKEGKLEYEDHALELYKWYLRKKLKGVRGFRIGFDPGNSVGALLKDVLIDLGNEVFAINEKLDGRFPNHVPNPAKEENLKQLKELVINKKLDFGIALDGDCDRFGIVDESGKRVTADKVIIPFIKENRKFVLEISLPLYLRRKIKNYVLSRTGHIFVKRLAKKENAYLGAEYSYHFMFKENNFIDDGLFSALRFIKELLKKKIWFNDIKVPEYYYERKEIEIHKYPNLIGRAIEFAKKNRIEYNTLDGVELLFDFGRLLIRKSNTEPLYRIVIESYDKNKINQLYLLLNDLLAK